MRTIDSIHAEQFVEENEESTVKEDALEKEKKEVISKQLLISWNSN